MPGNKNSLKHICSDKGSLGAVLELLPTADTFHLCLRQTNLMLVGPPSC